MNIFRWFQIAFWSVIVLITGVSFRATQTGPVARGEQPFSGVQAEILATQADGTLTWIYPTAYTPGAIPVIECLPQAVGAAMVACELDGPPTNRQARIRATMPTNVHLTSRLSK
jgi:hypothetical protein